jgi:CspA family cold shock protein
MAEGKTTRGKVKWFNNAKGYGFILPEEGGDDLFAHYSSIEMDGYKTLKAGQDVDFELVEGPKGLHATHIRAAQSASADDESMSVADQTAPTGDGDGNGASDGHTTEVLSVTVEGTAGLDGGSDEHLEPGQARHSN